MQIAVFLRIKSSLRFYNKTEDHKHIGDRNVQI